MEHLVVELSVASVAELTTALQREVAERLLLSALRAQDAADVAEVSMKGAAFLAAESRRLAASLDEDTTLMAIERMSLPQLGAWCIVDTLDEHDTMHRLTIIHPDPAKQVLLEQIEGRWLPSYDDKFGLPAVLRRAQPTVIEDEVDAVLANAGHDRDVVDVVRALGVGPLLTVPLLIGERLVGAVTFVGARPGQLFTPADIEMAEDLAGRSAMALDRARLYGEAIMLKHLAESANEAKSAFLGMMSHELRTPLNAIGGYVDLIDLEVHGPVTEAQHVDLGRIRSNQRYLMGLISDLLNFTSLGSGQLEYNVLDIVARDVLAASVAIVGPMIAQKRIQFAGVTCGDELVVRGDPHRVSQILVNLISNGIKFTPADGRLIIDCDATDDMVMMHVSDTGIGIPPDKLDVIFEPFVQVKTGAAGPEAGIGLGLAISRNLARAMHGDLTVESVLGKGARFTLRLPRAVDPTPS